MISTSVAGQISSDSSNVVELVTALSSKQDNMWIDIQCQGESDVPEDHDKHQDWGQLDVFRFCSLHKRLQRQKDWKETVILSRFPSYSLLNLELCPRRRCRNIPLGTPVTFTAHVTLKWVILSFSLRVIHKTFSGNVQVLALTSSGEKYTRHKQIWE